MKRWAIGVVSLAVVAGTCLAPGFAGAASGQSRIERFAQTLRDHSADMEFGALDLDEQKQTLELRDVRMKDTKERRPVTIRSLQFYDLDWDSEPAPRHGRVRARDVNFGLDVRDETARKLKDLGYEAVIVDADFHFDYDEQREKFAVDLRVDFREMGLLTSEFEAHGVTRQIWAALAERPDNEEAVTAAVAAMRIEKFSLRYDGPSRRLAAALPVSVQGVTMDVSGLDKASVLPRLARVTMRGLTVDVDLAKEAKDQEGKEALKELGYSTIQANLDYQCTFDDRSKSLEALVNLDLIDMGGLRYEVSLGGLGPLLSLASSSRTLLDKGPEELAAFGMGALAMTVNRASLQYEDHSLMERVIAVAARKRGVSPEEIRGEMLTEIEAKRREIPEMAAQQAFDAAMAFVRKPGVIGVNLRPETPVSYAELAALVLGGDYIAVVRRLKLQVESR